MTSGHRDTGCDDVRDRSSVSERRMRYLSTDTLAPKSIDRGMKMDQSLLRFTALAFHNIIQQ
jgi:hypothetical protein